MSELRVNRIQSQSGLPIEIPTSIGFTSAGAGAVATNVQSKLREFVSVKDFGAVGDGVVDDTAAIQACFNFCQTAGITALVTAGVYRVSQVNIGSGMTIVGDPGATFKLLDNQHEAARMLSTQFFSWVPSPHIEQEHSRVLRISGLNFDGNRQNQGPYNNYQKQHQGQVFLQGNNDATLGAPRLRVIIENCTFRDSCSDGITVYNGVDLVVTNCFFWDCFRGSVVIVGHNIVVAASNLRAGGTLYPSWFQIEQENTGPCNVSLTNSIFDVATTAPNTSIGLDLICNAGSAITVSNCIFNAGVSHVYTKELPNVPLTTFQFTNCFFRALHGDALVDYGNTTFTNCVFSRPAAVPSSVSLLSVRHFISTVPKTLILNNCVFDTESDLLAQLPRLTITSVEATNPGVFTVTVATPHGIPAIGNYSLHEVIIEGFTDAAYNKVYPVVGAPTATTLQIPITEFVGAPILGATPTMRIADSLPVAAVSTMIGTPVHDTLIVQNCRFSRNLRTAVNCHSGTLQFHGNQVNSSYAVITSAFLTPIHVVIGSNVFNCGALKVAAVVEL